MADLATIVTEIFEKFDLNKDGTLEPSELEAWYAELSGKRADLGLTADTYAAWFQAIDKDGDGTVSPSEVEAYLTSINYTA